MLPLPIPRLHLFEIDDQSWFPSSLRAFVQACLTHLWNLHARPIQPASPAILCTRILQKTLGNTLHSYTFIDFCAGAGGPTPFIERKINNSLNRPARDGLQNGDTRNGEGEGEVVGEGGVDFVLTDIHPHLAAWSAAAKKSAHLYYVPQPVDASNAPPDLLALAGIPKYLPNKSSSEKPFRLFNLAFHHFPDPLAASILHNTLATSSGFAIFELQGRDLGNILTVLMLGPLLWMGSWYWFWGEWSQLFWTYVVPVVPFVLVFDGVVSCLRTRREEEVAELIRQVEKGEGGRELVDGWRFECGSERHTWPGGTVWWFIGIREEGK